MPATPTTALRARSGWLWRVVLGWGVLAAVGTVLVSCLHVPAPNAAYPATSAEIEAVWERMREQPSRLERPVIVLNGYRSPSLTGWALVRAIETLTGARDGEVRMLSYPLAASIEEPARRAVAFVEKHYPSADPLRTTEVDVVAISMGGLVARVAAADPALRGEPGGKQLRIHTLYTLASPHRGARMAAWIALDPAARAMRPGSEFLARLDRALGAAEYEIVPYAVLRDRLVGATNAAPTGQQPIWVPGRAVLSHYFVALERRIQTDLALRLRNEAPLARPSAPPRD